MPNKTIRELLINGIHSYGINMFCAGRYHGEALTIEASTEKDQCRKQENKYGKHADEIMETILEVLNKDFVVKTQEEKI